MPELMRCPFCGLLQDESIGVKERHREAYRTQRSSKDFDK
jgi:hypothetical protein